MDIMDYFAVRIVPRLYRGKGAFHPEETGALTDTVSCVRENDVNLFFIRKGGTQIAVDAGYKNHGGFLAACEEIGVSPEKTEALFLTHADPDHAGGLDTGQKNHFGSARVYLGEIEENYLKNTYYRKKVGPFGLKNSVTIRRGYRLLKDEAVVRIGGIKVHAYLVPGHTRGHLCYLIDDSMLFTGDAIALNQAGGWCFFDLFNDDSKMNIQSLKRLKRRIDLSQVKYVFTAHNGFTDDAEKAFRHIDAIPNLKDRGFVFDSTAPYDCFAKEK